MGSTFRFRIAAGATGGKFQRIPILFSNIFLFFTRRIGSFLGMVWSTELHVKYGCEIRHGKRRRLPSLGAQRSVHKTGAYCRIDRLKMQKKKERNVK